MIQALLAISAFCGPSNSDCRKNIMNCVQTKMDQSVVIELNMEVWKCALNSARKG
jgi:hypothetical protein